VFISGADKEVVKKWLLRAIHSLNVLKSYWKQQEQAQGAKFCAKDKDT